MGFIFIRTKWITCAELLLRSVPRASCLRHPPTHTHTARIFRGRFNFSYEIFRCSHWKTIHQKISQGLHSICQFYFVFILCPHEFHFHLVHRVPTVLSTCAIHHVFTQPQIKSRCTNMYNFTHTSISWVSVCQFQTLNAFGRIDIQYIWAVHHIIATAWRPTRFERHVWCNLRERELVCRAFNKYMKIVIQYAGTRQIVQRAPSSTCRTQSNTNIEIYVNTNREWVVLRNK